jgi:hypothetical protein
MRLKNSSGLFVDTIRCTGNRKPAVDGSIGPRSDRRPNSIYGRCPVCRQVRPVSPKGTLVGHDEPLRLVVHPFTVGGDDWTAYGAPWHPIELASIPTRIAAEFAWENWDGTFMTFHGGVGHKPVTDDMPDWVQQWLSIHLRFVEQWTGGRDIIDLIPASQAYRLPMLSSLVV